MVVLRKGKVGKAMGKKGKGNGTKGKGKIVEVKRTEHLVNIRKRGW